MKKAQEFTTLCGVYTCMIIYGPVGSTATTEPEVWPASPEKVKGIIERYMSEGGPPCQEDGWVARVLREPEEEGQHRARKGPTSKLGGEVPDLGGADWGPLQRGPEEAIGLSKPQA